MADFNVRSDSVDVEQIMRQIRARIREKRGADYTEAELQQLATVKLEQFLDPRGVRSDLVEQFRRHRIVSEPPPTYEFEEDTLYKSHRVPLLARLRRLLRPVLKLFFNPDPITHALHLQAVVNAEYHRRFRQREELDPLMYELVHNLVVEVTRLGIEVHNLKMRVESLSSRVDFDERRARALEGVVQYRAPALQRAAGASAPAASPQAPAGVPSNTAPGNASTPGAGGGSPGSEHRAGEGERRRRRRRRRRRPGQTMASAGAPAGASQPSMADSAAPVDHEPDDADGPEDDGAADQ